jgi:hypothetical protein
MSASEKLKALEQRIDALIESAPQTEQERFAIAALALLFHVSNALPQVVAVVEAAEIAELKLRSEYRSSWPTHSPVVLDDLPEWEKTWAEGQRLADALAALDEALTQQPTKEAV